MSSRFAIRVAAAAAFAVVFACVPKQYYVLSPDTDYSDDPSLNVRLLALDEVSGDSRIVIEVENHTKEPVNLADARIEVYDYQDTSYEPTPVPKQVVEPGAVEKLELTFATAEAPGQTFEVRFADLPVKVWPIVYSKEKPPDFKATPEPPQGGPPQRPPGPY